MLFCIVHITAHGRGSPRRSWPSCVKRVRRAALQPAYSNRPRSTLPKRAARVHGQVDPTPPAAVPHPRHRGRKRRGVLSVRNPVHFHAAVHYTWYALSGTKMKRPRWTWRILLTLPALACWTGWAFDEVQVLDPRLAHQLNFQIAHGCLLFGPMPDPRALDAWHEFLRDKETSFCHWPWDAHLAFFLLVACAQARTEGVVRDALWPGSHFIAALWVVALPLSALGFPLFMAVQAELRRTMRFRQHRCIGCGYSLRGLIVPRCPECGLPHANPALPAEQLVPPSAP